MKTFLKKLAVNLTLVMFSLLFTLGMLEIVARAMHLGTGGFWEPYPTYGWRNIPGASGWESCYGECEVYVEINSKGLRDREIPYENPQNKQRVLMLGDSMTAAMQVSLEDTFSKQMEMHLGDSWEVINGGVNGFGTDNELIFYREETYQYDPDIVIVNVYLANDIYNNSRTLELRTGGESHKPYFTLSESGELELQNFPAANTDTIGIKIGSFFKKHFQLPRFIAQTMNLRGQVPTWLQPVVSLFGGNRGVAANEESQNGEEQTTSQPARVPTICDEEYTPEIEEAWDITKAIILQMREEVEANGSQLAFVILPTAAQVVPPKEGAEWYCERPNLELTTFLNEEGIAYLDLLYPFRDYMLAGGETLYYKRDFHMNIVGNHLAGELIGQFVEQNLINE